MNQKKCPKCGENNPPEAVMCWACYTPLAGAAAGAAATPAAGGPPSVDAEEKPKIAPLHMALIGVGLLVAIGVGGFATGMIGGGGGDPGGDPVDGPDKPPSVGDPSTENPSPLPPAGAPAPAPGPESDGSPSAAPSYTSPFAVISPPNPKSGTGVMAIMPTKTLSPEGAASLAAFSYRQVNEPGKWPVFHIFVFNNDKAAEIFKDYQIKKRSAGLTDGDYRQLANSDIWKNAVVRWEFRSTRDKGVETVRYPYRNPTGWWFSKSS